MIMQQGEVARGKSLCYNNRSAARGRHICRNVSGGAISGEAPSVGGRELERIKKDECFIRQYEK